MLDVAYAAAVIAPAQEVGDKDVLANLAVVIHAGTKLECTEEGRAQAVAPVPFPPRSWRSSAGRGLSRCRCIAPAISWSR